jgi:hypothetical protein
VAGKSDWLAAELPFEGTAQLVGQFTRRDVATATESTPAREAPRRLDVRGFGPVVMLNGAGVVMGAAYRDALASATEDATAGTVIRFGVSNRAAKRAGQGRGAPDGSRQGKPDRGHPHRTGRGRVCSDNSRFLSGDG